MPAVAGVSGSGDYAALHLSRFGSAEWFCHLVSVQPATLFNRWARKHRPEALGFEAVPFVINSVKSVGP
jgi:hypothetical protein